MTPPAAEPDTETAQAVTALMSAANVVLAINIDSLTVANHAITPSQLRLLLIVRNRGHTNLTTVAAQLVVRREFDL